MQTIMETKRDQESTKLSNHQHHLQKAKKKPVAGTESVEKSISERIALLPKRK